jgi:hypothetical protein
MSASTREEISIAVVVEQTEDCIEVVDAESALVAAHDLRKQARAQGIGVPAIQFWVDKQIVQIVKGAI